LDGTEIAALLVSRKSHLLKVGDVILILNIFIIDFKTAAEKGIQTGKIRSIIHPTLADHVRREALKAADELKRAA
jgi:hypothetical protein